MKVFFFISLLVFAWVETQAQSSKKSINYLLIELKTAKEDTAKVNLYNTISKHYLATNIDSVQVYASKGITLSKKLQYEEGEIMSLNALGNYYENKTEFEKALTIYNQALKISKKINSTKGFAVLYNNIGMVHIKQGKYDSALTLMIEALKAEEKLKNNKGIAQAYNNIGVIYFYQQNFRKATDYFEKSLEMEERAGDKEAVKQAINNLGAVYDYMKEYDKAIAQYQKAHKINSNNNDKREMATNLHNIAVAYYKKGNYTESKKYHNESLELRRKSGDQNALALAYFNYGELLRSSGKNKEAKEYYENALEIAVKNDLKIIKQHVFGSLSKLYESENNYKLANELLYKYIAVKDSILNTENSKIIADTETKYQTEKKEREILVQRAQIAENQLKIERKNQLILAIISLAVLGGLIGYQFYRVQKIRNKQLEKENQLKDALIKIETQNKLHEQRLRISRDLHDNIGSQLTFIISSIDNLKFILNKENPEISDRLEDISYFTRHTITELRDTIWAMSKENISFADLKIRINNFIENAKLATKGIDFNFEIDEKIDEEFSFSALEGINIYRVIQESINNSIKHAEPTEIQIKFKKNGERFVICVLDNGIGLDENNVKLGNGLHNMYKRIAELGGELTINNNKGKGTKLKINI